MKKLIIISVIILFALSTKIDANTNISARIGGYFYTSLSPYGTWIDIGFGTPVWKPTIIKRGWEPYYRGRWIYTDYGWYWDSYEPFGYIVYHYGRWYYDDYYGWIWIPDDQWAPAWVDWRYDDDYVGWAPLPPYALFSINIGIHYTYDYHIPYTHWHFVKYKHFCDDNIYKYYVPSKIKYRVFERTKVRTDYSYYNGRIRNDGVGFDIIRERSGRKIEKRNLVTVNDPRELTKTRNSNNRDREIRTYIANREDISRDGLRDIKVQRSERKTSLDLNKVEIGRDRNPDRTNQRNNEVITKDRNQGNVERQRSDEIIKRDVQKDISRERINEEKKIQQRNDSQRRNNEIEKRNNDQIRRNEEKIRNEKNRSDEQILLQKKSNYGNRQSNEANVESRVNTEVNKNIEKKIEQRNQNPSVNNRNNEMRKRETTVRQQENRTEKRSEERNNNFRRR